jgi:hypothetical protein
MKKSVKQKLVEYMIENGNDFRYTDMVKRLLKICRGESYEYDPASPDRGFYATNFNSFNGYLRKGGNCCVYKNPSGRWSAKFFTDTEIKEYKISNIINGLTSSIKMATSEYNRQINNSYSWEYRNYANIDYRDRVNSLKSDATKKILKLSK